VLHISIWGAGALFGGYAHQSPLMATGLYYLSAKKSPRIHYILKTLQLPYVDLNDN